MEDKRGMLLIVAIGLFFTIFYCGFGCASLGISPAIYDLDYVPGGEYEITYHVISDNPNSEVEVYAGGDFREYVTLSEKTVTGTGDFKVKIKMPFVIDKPGEHRIGIGAREKPAENQFIGTAIDISGSIRFFVPYPGRYAEIELNIPNGNIDENIPVEAHVTNKGVESLNVNTEIQFFEENGRFVYDMPFTPVVLASKEDRYFRKYLDTKGYKAGNYYAKAIVDYGDVVEINRTFRIGSLSVDIVNFTEKLQRGGIQKFFINIESKWNDNLNEVYADVNISNATKSFEFRTPSVSLGGWQKETLTGFLDTEGMAGQYKTAIVLNYGGQKNSVSGWLEIIEGGAEVSYIVWGIIGIIILIVIIFIIWRIKRISISKMWINKKMLGKKR